MSDLPPAEPDSVIAPHRFDRRILVGVLALAGIYSAVAIATDSRQLLAALRTFRWILIVPIIGLTLWNYGLRFLKWQMYLRELGVSCLDWLLSLRIYLAGFAMSITPGKAGEVIKAVYLRDETGLPVTRGSAAVAAERGSDAFAMLILAGIGATQFSYGRAFLVLVAGAGVTAVLLLQRPELLGRAAVLVNHIPGLRRLSVHVEPFLHASSSLFRPSLLVRAVGLGVVSWAGECVAFFLVLVGLGLTGNWLLLLIATFVLAVSSLAGGASMLPGGLGVTDASAAGMLILLVNDDAMNRSIAVAAPLMIRFATLWFAVLLGGLALASLEHRA